MSPAAKESVIQAFLAMEKTRGMAMEMVVMTAS